MKNKNIIIEKAVRALAFVAVIFATGIYSCSVKAQGYKAFKYVGFGASFGQRSFNIASDIPQINGMHADNAGGSLSLVGGNDLVMIKVRGAGFFYSSSNTPRTIEIFEMGGSANLYPLQWFRKNSDHALDIYLTAGINKDNIKFYGHYLGDNTTNYSSSNEPYLGKIKQISATAGIGLEYRLPYQFDFVHLFMEARYGAPVQSSTDRAAFANTSIKNFTAVSVGVCFGKKR